MKMQGDCKHGGNKVVKMRSPFHDFLILKILSFFLDLSLPDILRAFGISDSPKVFQILSSLLLGYKCSSEDLLPIWIASHLTLSSLSNIPGLPCPTARLRHLTSAQLTLPLPEGNLPMSTVPIDPSVSP